MKEDNAIVGYKGFDKNMKCRGFQFEVGKTYKEDKAIICEKGFHFCENPIDIFSYYDPANSKFAEVSGAGKIAKHNDDSKVVCTKLHVKAEVSLSALIGIGVKFILDKVDWKNNKITNTGYRSAATNTGERSAATNTGDRSAATNTGYRSAATNTGYRSAATVEGKESIACGLGYDNSARGALGCWIVLAERDDEYKIISVKTGKVDGKKIKADTFYKLQNGKFVEVK
jgi:hypothetical protein